MDERDATDLQPQQSGADYNPYTDAKGFVQRPFEEVHGAAMFTVALRDFWKDMNRRPSTNVHRSLLILGILLGLIALVCGVVAEVLIVEHRGEVRHYAITARVIAGVAQIVYTVYGSSTENAALLLVATLNALGVVVRVALQPLMDPVAWIPLLSLLCLGTIGHGALSFFLWYTMKLERFMAFCIGTEEHIQRMYRQYQLFIAFTLVDMQCAVTALVTAFFFVEKMWWYYWIIAVVLLVLNFALRSLLRLVIRKETRRAPVLGLIPLYLLMPVGICLALWYEYWEESTVPHGVRGLAIFTVGMFVAARLAMLGAAIACFRNFGLGMKAAFKAEKSAVDFVRTESTKTYASPFLPDDAASADAA